MRRRTAVPSYHDGEHDARAEAVRLAMAAWVSQLPGWLSMREVLARASINDGPIERGVLLLTGNDQRDDDSYVGDYDLDAHTEAGMLLGAAYVTCRVSGGPR